MSKELDLKSGTKASTKRLTMVKLLNDAVFFGIHGSQLASGMQGLHMSWNGDVVVVTSDNYPGQEKWVFPGNIASLTWIDE